MKPSPTASPIQPQIPHRQPLVVGVVTFGLGVALAGAWFYSHRPGSEKSGGLSTTTQKLLGQLATPVSIRYYSLLPAGSVDESLQAFSARVTQLLNDLQTAGGGKIQRGGIHVG